MGRQAEKVNISNPELTGLLQRLGQTRDLAEAKVIGTEFLSKCVMKDTIAAKQRELDGMTSVIKIYSLCFNTMLSGEGLKVLK
jgi:hypothetical protein